MTLTQLRAHIETDLPDEALQRILSAAETDVLKAAGPASAAVDEFEAEFPGAYVTLRQPATVPLTLVTEYYDTAATVLTSADYELRQDKRRLYRVGAYWAPRVVVAYEPTIDLPAREAAAVDLVQLAIQNTGLASERIGDYSSQAADQRKERARILARVRTGGILA